MPPVATTETIFEGDVAKLEYPQIGLCIGGLKSQNGTFVQGIWPLLPPLWKYRTHSGGLIIWRRPEPGVRDLSEHPIAPTTYRINCVYQRSSRRVTRAVASASFTPPQEPKNGLDM